MIAGHPQLWMIRPHLEELPAVQPPRGYSVRSYRPGDGEHWERILCEAFQTRPGTLSFEETMRRDPAFRPERIFFAVCGEEPVATASAYYFPCVMPDAGTVHYVAALKAHRGRRLGYWVVLAALHRMRAEGRRRAWLSTDDFRLPAIKTYLRLGYEPLLFCPGMAERWRQVRARLQ